MSENYSGIGILTRSSLSTTGRPSQVSFINESVYGEFKKIIDDRNWSWSYLRKTFNDLNLKSLYRLYVQRLQNAYFNVYLILQFVVSLIFILIILLYNLVVNKMEDSTLKTVLPETLSHVIIATSSITIFFFVCDEKLFRSKKGKIQILMSIIQLSTLVITDLGLSTYFYIKEGVVHTSCAFHTLIIIYFFLPLPKIIHSIICGVLVSIFHLILSGVLLYCEKDNRVQRIIADFVYYFCVNLVGFYSKLLSEVTVRRAFLDRRGYIKSVSEKKQEKTQEEHLLLSILPMSNTFLKVKEELRNAINQYGELCKGIDLHPSFHQRFSTSTQTTFLSNSRRNSHVQQKVIHKKPFSDLFVERHMNVTILYADIVNFTPLTIKLNADELVQTLNELFGLFDNAATRNDCLRIKLLGDCYNCVSGIPNPTPHHAKNCVELGFEMIYILRDLRERLNMDISMRIGLHSGNVLSGLLGIYKWQYDIWSKDVTIANHMEQSGKPDLIHITRQSKEILGDRYEYKEDFGKFRDKYLKENDIDTFLIVGTKKIDQNQNEIALQIESSQDEGTQTPTNELKPFVKTGSSVISSGRRNSGTQSMISRSRMIGSGGIRTRRYSERITDVTGANLLNFKKMMDKINEQMEKDIFNMPISKNAQWCGNNGKGDENSINHKNLHPLFLTFNPLLTEVDFQIMPDPLFKYYISCALVVLLSIGIIQVLIVPSNHRVLWIVFCLSLSIILFLIPLAWVKFIWGRLKDPHMELDEIPTPKNKFINFLYKTSHKITNSWLLRMAIFLLVSSAISASAILDVIQCGKGGEDVEILSSEDECKAPWYFSYSCALAILGIYGFFRVHYLLKLLMTLLAFSGYIYTVFNVKKQIFESEFEEIQSLPSTYSHAIYLLRIIIFLHIMDRQMEYINRLDFIWKQKLNEEHREASLTHAINKILIHNILPVTTAKIYMDPNRVNEWQSSRYQNVSVMFASIPNFTDFYTENDFNDQGMKCLQLLNEIIVEFDQVLFDFNEVEKIKLIGSTYMAAAGLEVQENARLSTTSIAENFAGWREPHHHHHHHNNKSLINYYKRRKTLHTLAKFAASMMVRLESINKHAFQEFQLRVGIECGGVIGGVIGAQKPFYDVWGDSVNTASRMESTGVLGKIQVTEESAKLLMLDGVKLDLRGPIKVKGKDHLITTYFVKLNEDFNICYETQEEISN